MHIEEWRGVFTPSPKSEPAWQPLASYHITHSTKLPSYPPPPRKTTVLLPHQTTFFPPPLRQLLSYPFSISILPSYPLLGELPSYPPRQTAFLPPQQLPSYSFCILPLYPHRQLPSYPPTHPGPGRQTTTLPPPLPNLRFDPSPLSPANFAHLYSCGQSIWSAFLSVVFSQWILSISNRGIRNLILYYSGLYWGLIVGHWSIVGIHII